MTRRIDGHCGKSGPGRRMRGLPMRVPAPSAWRGLRAREQGLPAMRDKRAGELRPAAQQLSSLAAQRAPAAVLVIEAGRRPFATRPPPAFGALPRDGGRRDRWEGQKSQCERMTRRDDTPVLATDRAANVSTALIQEHVGRSTGALEQAGDVTRGPPLPPVPSGSCGFPTSSAE